MRPKLVYTASSCMNQELSVRYMFVVCMLSICCLSVPFDDAQLVTVVRSFAMGGTLCGGRRKPEFRVASHYKHDRLGM